MADSYVVVATTESSIELVGAFASDSDAREFVQVEEENGAAAQHSVLKLMRGSASPFQAKGRW